MHACYWTWNWIERVFWMASKQSVRKTMLMKLPVYNFYWKSDHVSRFSSLDRKTAHANSAWGKIMYFERMMWTIKVKNDHRSKFSSLRNWKEEAWKNRGFNRIRTRDLRDTGAIGSKVNLLSSFSREEWNDVKYIWNNSYIWPAVVDQSEEWSSQ